MKLHILLIGASLLATVSISCGGGARGSGESLAKASLEAQPISVDAEQVLLTGPQVDCGVKEELWEAPQQIGGRTTARLTQNGRDLKFADDVSITEPGYTKPYVQVRGQFPVQVSEVGSIKDGPDGQTKIAQIKGGIVIQHACFSTPLPLMGVKNGRFTHEVPPRFQFQPGDEKWTFEKLVH